MKLILMRHEERGPNPGFFTELTDNGIVNSCIIPDLLKDFNIDIIFSSPFIRTLQTIYPYSKKYNKKINVDYGLYEYIHNLYFKINNWYYTLNDIKDEELKNIINNDYISIVNKNDFKILEDEKSLENRIIKFFSYLNTNYYDKTVLLVSHKGVINKIKDVYIKNTGMDDEFEMGSIEFYNI
jgi:broad specificity phosphatase PhoE